MGPKLSGAIGLDLTTMPWEDEATYTLMKNTKLSLHMFDADYEVKGTVETAFSGKKEVTLLDGGFNIFPPLDAAVVPEFGDCEEAVEERIFQKKDQEAWASAPAELDGQRLPCRVFSFEPSGAVIFPVATGACLYKKNEAGEYVDRKCRRTCIRGSYYGTTRPSRLIQMANTRCARWSPSWARTSWPHQPMSSGLVQMKVERC